MRDRERGIFAHPEKVHHIGHHGEFFKVPGIHLAEPSPQRTPVLYQAGASPRGIAFAAQHAEAIFIGAPTRAVARDSVSRIRKALVNAGRRPDSAKIYLLTSIISDSTEAAARAKHAELLQYSSVEGVLTFMSGWLGVDLSKYSLDDPIGAVRSNAIQSTVAAFQAENPDGRQWTVRDIANWGRLSGLGSVLVGSPSRVADELQAIVEETGVDGFNLAYAISPGTFEDVVEFIVPELQRRGVYQTEYAPGTLRHKLFGAGDRLPAEHRGSLYRVGGPLSTIDDVTGTGRPLRAEDAVEPVGAH